MSVLYLKEDVLLKNEDGNIVKLDKLEVSKNDIITSSIDISDIIAFTLRLPKSTPKEQLASDIELQFYENAGIDPNKQFKLFYILKDLSQEENYLIEVLAVDEELLHQKYQDLIEKIKYIDFISFSPFSFVEFYDLYQKEPKRDAFVYLDNKQSFVAIYENGEYLYSKTLNSLSSLLKSLSIDYKEFVELISTKGVDKEKYDMEEFLIAGEIDKFFSEYFMAINNRVSYGKSVFYLENIDNVYFYTPFKIEGIDSLKNFWDLSGINFEIIPVEEINFLDKLSLIYNSNHLDDEKNFSIFPRPPKFYKTKTFQLMMVILVVLLVFGGDFGYRYYTNKQLKNELHYMDIKIKQEKLKLKKLKIINKKILSQLSVYHKKINKIKQQEKYMTEVLQTSLKLINTQRLSKDLITISNLLKKDNLKAFIISKDANNSFDIGVYTNLSQRKYISVFMNDLVKHNYKNVVTDHIVYQKDKYISNIRFNK